LEDVGRAMPVNEAYLKGQLRDCFKKHLRGCIVLRHEDHFTAGIPDASITWKKRTTWLEAKHARPTPKALGVQIDTCNQLSISGYCWFVVYQERRGERRTLMVEPQSFYDLDSIPGECVTSGFNHYFVVDFIRSTYGYPVL
jgi:hypothetical protein